MSVYRARDTRHNRPVVAKLLQPHLQAEAELVERFRREAERLVDLRHPHIAPARELCEDQGRVCLVTEVPAGEPLERRLTGQGPLEIDDVLNIVSHIAEALDYAHERGLLHQDVRPANIYLDGQRAILADFYLLEAVGATPVYMAPEQLDETSAQTIDRRSDMYALGVVVYEMLTGRPPFVGTATEVATAHLTQRPTLPRVLNPDLPPSLDAILLKALAKQPQSRYKTAGGLAVGLREAIQVAQTRRMSDTGEFDVLNGVPGEASFRSSFLEAEGGVPIWAWVGAGILLVVLISIIILVMTG